MTKWLSLVLWLITPISFSEPASIASIEKMFSLVHIDRMVEQKINQLETNLVKMMGKKYNKPEQQQKLKAFAQEVANLMKAELNWQQMKQPIISAYQQVFSEQEIQAAIHFYETPAGQKMLTKMPQLMRHSAQIAMEKMANIKPKFMAIVQKYQQDFEPKPHPR